MDIEAMLDKVVRPSVNDTHSSTSYTPLPLHHNLMGAIVQLMSATYP